LVPDISKKHSAFIFRGQAEQDKIANREVWQNTGRVLIDSNWPEGWLSEVWKGPVCAVVALTNDTVRCCRGKYLVTISTPMEQLVCSDQAARCFLVIIHASHQILLL
jgi:hypothetical protein